MKEIIARITSDPRYQKNIEYGEPRAGHPKGDTIVLLVGCTICPKGTNRTAAISTGLSLQILENVLIRKPPFQGL
ncbi:MAG TPA: hypothetical protein VK249_28270 [Anaerolineales bacterium]|nr:hypothetical protein [Anaerolineales bacterium]